MVELLGVILAAILILCLIFLIIDHTDRDG
jgi:hypothetical protein